MAFDNLIISTLIPEWPAIDDGTRRGVELDTTASVVRAIARAPLHLRIAVSIVSSVIGFLLMLTVSKAGGLSARIKRADRLYAMLARLPGPAISVIRLYRSLTLLAYYDNPAIIKLLTASSGTDRGKAL